MVLEGGGAGRARAAAVVSTGLGLLAMVSAPLARSAAAPGHADPAPAATVTASASVAPAAGEAPSRPSRTVPKDPEWVHGSGAAKALVYAPAVAAASPRPVTVLMHGLCGHPQNSCAPFVDVATSRGWLVCPQGEDACGTGARWHLRPADDAQVIEDSVAELGRGHAGDVDGAAGRILVGFSMGGIAAVQIAQSASPGTYAGLVVIASQIQPDARALERAGIKRVVFAAGDLDMTSAPLQADARALDARGLPTRFVSLGRFGHGYPADMKDRMREPMEWVAGG